MTDRIFLDTNLLMELLFNRAKADICRDILQKPEKTFCISALSVHICNYFLEKSGHNPSELQSFFEAFEITPLDKNVLGLSYTIFNQDFEDAIQVASAIVANCQEIYTLDKQISANYADFTKIITL